MFLLIGAAFGVAWRRRSSSPSASAANELTAAKRVVGTSATFFAGISVAHGHRGPDAAAEPLLIAMSTPADSLPMAVAYMRVIFLALPFLYMYAFVMGILRGAGDSKTPFYFMLLSVAIDIALNPVFIFGLGPIPRLGDRRLGAGHVHRAGHQPDRADPSSLPPRALPVPAQGRAALPEGGLVDRRDPDQEGHPDERADAGGLLERGAHDHAREPLRGRHDGSLRRGDADLELHPDAGIRSRHGHLGHGRAERGRRASGTA